MAPRNPGFSLSARGKYSRASASPDAALGMVKLTPDQQAMLVEGTRGLRAASATPGAVEGLHQRAARWKPTLRASKHALCRWRLGEYRAEKA